MTKTDQHVRFVRCKLGLACIAGVAASCTDRMASTTDGDRGPVDATLTDVDPTGSWNVSYTYSASCDRPPLVESTTFMVTRGPDGFALAVAGVTAAGTLTCTPDGCKLSGMFTWSVATAHFQQSVTIALDASDHLTGSGTELVVDGTGTCSYTFIVAGSKR